MFQKKEKEKAKRTKLVQKYAIRTRENITGKIENKSILKFINGEANEQN
jgi:hypothetical protein